jgi:hypothetical protein
MRSLVPFPLCGKVVEDARSRINNRAVVFMAAE